MNPLDDCWVPTPEDLANHMVSLLKIVGTNQKVLEPSAGEGALVTALYSLDVFRLRVVAVEPSPERFTKLCKVAKSCKSATADCQVLQADFLTINPDNFLSFDAVVLSPPFHSENDPTADITHVRHAYSFLRPGGRLVAIMHPRLLDGSSQSQTFLLGLRRFEIEYLPRGTFPTHPHVEAVLLAHTKEAP